MIPLFFCEENHISSRQIFIFAHIGEKEVLDENNQVIQ